MLLKTWYSLYIPKENEYCIDFFVYHRILFMLCNLFNENEDIEKPMCFFNAVKNNPHLYIETSQRMASHIPKFFSHFLDFNVSA